jgi:hypothetical protein
MPLYRIAILALVTVGLFAVEAKVLTVPAADRVVVVVSGLPVAVSLAHIDVPESIAASTQKELASMLEGKSVSVEHLEAWGVDAAGAGKVHMRVGKTDVVLHLVEEGLAKVVAGSKADSTKDRLLELTQDRARTAKKGLWGASQPAIASRSPAANPPAKEPSGAFAAELNGKFYFPSGHRALANVAKQRLIYYADEASAKKAGKVAAPSEPVAAMGEATEANADAIFKVGEGIYADAIAAGNSTKRDDLYEKAFVKLSDAMNIYGSLVEKDENNEALAEKLRRCMQLRYGAMKQRRAH